MGFLQGVFNTLSLFPFIPFILVYMIVLQRNKNRKQAFGLAMDVTTFFLLFSVSALFNNTFQSKSGFYLILLMLLIATGLIGSAQNRWKGKVNGKRLARAVWRLGFVAMSFGYVVFTFFGILSYIIKVT
ncbi:DUF3397 domain-containing protein [Paenibacillus glucanolyticus]|jgi:hypothetical protein|uniref:DUF3397 domain-containing protein n=1 Tax=Paenibacillus glucanolyticus TaxID=59843 RepID=A0A163L0N8_9BACL|nr:MULTISPECIES: DUF3397 domain-containing protein [Paenibacillus]ANA81665.1 hypothetical protein A3958_17565 [Paenibacillus glucanolyticus]AVV59601.1 DUF3397 domain-containing protein [Paenibacillus glucanolyticus]AWP28859.1 hypothetical protein B9D94_20540 [Paenibacillus sp. Cedars]ETT42099.1 hypothetical protein C169_05072 [Paenibacillus sp. FSL R5-808]KZS47706.1 hypothetical protein AWU65_18140 [Paenibacillus glucanolyticus]